MPTLDTSERHPICLILNFAHGESEEGKVGDEDVLWKDILAEGVIARTPGLKDKIPFKVVHTGRSSSRDGNITVSMSDLQESFDAGAFPSGVTIPDGHPKPDRVLPDGKVIKGDSALNNTGYVRGLRTVKKRVKRPDGTTGPEIHVLQAGLGFTEPDVAGRAKRGSIPNVSAGVFFDFVRKADDRYFRAALNHVALTKQPWMMDIEPFQRAYFADGDSEYEFTELMLDDRPDDKDAKVIWQEEAASGFIRESLSKALNPEPSAADQAIGVPDRPRAFYYVQDVTHVEPNLAQVEESYKGKTERWVVPYSQNDDGTVTPSPQTHWQKGHMAMIAASDEDETVASFEQNTLDHVRDRLAVALDDMFGDKHALVIGTVSTDGRALVRNTDTGAEHIARFREVGQHAYLTDTATWTTVKLPQSSKTNTNPAAETSSNVVKLDTSTPEGRVEAARQRRAKMLATSN